MIDFDASYPTQQPREPNTCQEPLRPSFSAWMERPLPQTPPPPRPTSRPLSPPARDRGARTKKSAGGKEKKRDDEEKTPPSALAPVVCPREEAPLSTVSQSKSHGHFFVISSSQSQEDLAKVVAEYITVEAKKGVMTTTLTVQAEDPTSCLHQFECTIKQYDTDQQSFMISMKSVPEATEMLTKQLATLRLALEKALPGFVIHLSPPSLLIARKKKGQTHFAKKKPKSSPVYATQKLTKDLI